MEIIILNLFYIILLITLLRRAIVHIRRTSLAQVLRSNDAALLLLLIIIGAGPVALFSTGIVGKSPPVDGIHPKWQFIISVFMSLLISGVWMMYIRKIDIYEKERWKHVFITFILGVLFSQLAVFGYGLFSSFGIRLNGYPINDLLYSVGVIGGLEEAVKIIPFLLLLKYSKAADEPYDFILYPSVSALGFAFAENIMYINNSGLINIGGRALYSTVAHMVFSSVVGYGMLLYRFRFPKRTRWVGFFTFFAIAAIMHGFYDFWLINYFVSSYSFLTTVFFLITIHIWFILKNNAVNISNYYDPRLTLDNDMLKWYLVLSLSSILMIGYIIVSLVYGVESGNRYLLTSWIAYGYMVLYLTLSFSRYKIKHGRLSQIKVPFDFFIPKPLKKNT